MPIVKLIHVYCAYATGLGFLLRGIFIILQSPMSKNRLTKILPHIIDTCLLISGLTMVVIWSVSPLAQPWLLAKLIALLIYIAFGMLMIRWGTTERRRWIGLIGGLVVYVYIVGVAHSKSELSLWFFV